MNILKRIKLLFAHKPKSRLTETGGYLTKIIVGLGNPGEMYENTRHNIGAIAIDQYVNQLGYKWKLFNNSLRYICIRGVTFVKPLECINKTGDTLAEFLKSFEIEKRSCKILILVDEIMLPLGQVRDKKETSPSRHNGIRNMIENFGDTFDRIRMGVGEKPKDTTTIDYVLEEFSPGDKLKLDLSCAEASTYIRKWIGSN
jgi:PTH1 family peptidyl-tRNA hydrolase